MDRRTIDIYEELSARYEARRTPRHRIDAARFGAGTGGGPVVDLGCGPGWYTAALGPRPVALDGAHAMLLRTREVAPDSQLVQADLAALPFRRGALAGAWARNSYVHLRAVDVPMALHDLHGALAVDAPVELTFFGADAGGGVAEGREVFPRDDLPGRWFSTWPAERLRDVVIGAGFSIDELEETTSTDGVGFTVRARRARTLADTVGAGMGVLVCGLNPSERAADAGVGFVTPGNRFWPAALATGLVSRDRDPRHALAHHGVGMTDLVKRATPRADELTAAEYRAGLARVERLCEWLQPRVLCVVGLAGWRAAVDRHAVAGVQPAALDGTPVYLLPSTSGANASSQLPDLVEHLRAVAALATTPARTGGLDRAST